MNTILIRGAIIVPVDDSRAGWFRGDLLVEGDRIATVSEKAGAVSPERADRVIDGSGMILMPGLVNTHGHAAMTLFRGFADDMPLKDWLEQKIWPAEANLTADDVYWGTMLAITEMLKSGTTTFTDMYFFMDRVAEAAAESGIRAVLARGLIGVSNGAGAALKEAEEFIACWHGSAAGRINATLGPHAPYTCPPDFLRRVMAVAEKTGRPLQIHLAETAGEVRDCRAQYGCTPVALLNETGLFDYPVLAAHCVHLEEADIAILAEKKVGVAHNPGSNLKLGSGVAPLSRLLEAGVTVGLGTDGAASNNNLDMFEEMRLAALLAKGTAMEPTLVPAPQALRLATGGGAEALALPGVGRLREGWKADLVGISLDVPHAAPLHDLPAHLVYAAAAADVRLVMVDGKILVENRTLTALDEEKIAAEAARRARRLTGKQEEGQR